MLHTAILTKCERGRQIRAKGTKVKRRAWKHHLFESSGQCVDHLESPDAPSQNPIGNVS